MKCIGRLVAVALWAVAMPVIMVASTITFDTGLSNENPISSPYEGLDWDNFYALNGATYSGNPSGYQNGMVSEPFVAYNANAGPAAFSSASPFDFNSVYLTGAWNDDLHIRVQGYLGATLLYDNTVVVNAAAPTLFNFNYLDIDRVLFTSSDGINHGYNGSGEHFVMDDLTINAAVPEPASFLLLAAGLAALLVCARRRKPTA